MDTRGSSFQSRGMRDLHGLHHGLFQTSTDRAHLRAAVYQVFGGQPWGGCCSDRLLETLLEAGQRSYLKQQLYWDFQLLDSDHDGYLSVRDAELLLAQVPHAYATGEAWQDFLRSRGPGVAWRDIEDWLFRAIQLPVEEPRAGRRRALHHERGPSAGSSTSLYRWGVRSRTEQPLERWDSAGPATLLGEEPSGVLAALERKYRVLQRKLCAEMLQAHYGQSAWASLPQNMKEDKLLELELLVDCGLRKGSVLSLACLPGARLRVRSEAKALESEGNVQCVSPSVMEGTAAEALEELRHRKQAETAAVLAQQHLLVGSNPEASRRLLHLHAQTALIHQEASFQAALLITELFQGERFWDSQPIVPEACHQELAQLRLAAGHGSEPAWREAKTMLGRSMTQVLLDRLLLQHERDRACLVQILLTLRGTETVHEQAHGSKQLVLPGAGYREDTSPALEEAVGQMLNLAQKRLEVARRADVPWQDCAVAVLADLQLAQEEELRQTIDDLVGIVSGREETCPALYENLLARLQEPLLMSLIRHLQPVPPQEKHTWESLKMGPGSSTEELSPRELEAQKMLQRGDVPDGPQEQNKVESQGPLLKKLKTCEHQDEEKDSEDHQNSVAPERDPNLTEDQQKSQDAFLLQTKSKSWGPPEFVKPQVLMPKELRDRAVVPQMPQTCHNLGGHCKEEGLACQAQNDSKCLAQGDVREATDHQTQISPERKKGPLQATEPSTCQASQHQTEKDPEFSHLQEALPEKSKSLDPQELSRPWYDEHCRPHQGEEEISGPQDGTVPKGCQPERYQETKAQETLQHHRCPRSEEKAVQVPHNEPEVAKRQDRQMLDASQEVSCPQELRNTKACQTEPFCPQEKLQQNLSRPQALKARKKAKKEPEAQAALSKKTKSVKSKEMSRSQGMVPLGNIHTHGMPEGRPSDFPQREPGPLQASTQGRRTPEKKSLGTIQEQKEPQNHYEILHRKSKSLELRRPPPFPSQELKTPFKQGRTQMGLGALEPKERRQVEDFPSQKQRQKPQSDQSEKLLQKQEVAQSGPESTGPQTTKAKEDVPAEEKARSKLSQSQEDKRKKSLREPHKKKDLETIHDPQRQKEALHIQEYGRPESPPLLWSVLWQKAKSFDVGKPYVFPIQKLRKLEEALTYSLPQKMKGSPVSQLQIHKLQEDKRPESPPLLWRILWQKSKSFELRKSCAFETQELRGSLIVQLQQGESQVETEASKFQELETPREAAHLTPRTRKVEAPRAPGTPPTKTQDLEETPRQKDAGGDAPEQQDLQALPSEIQTMSEQDLHPQNSRDSETPPLLWRVLGMKAKSFELRRPGPRTFRTQQARKLEPSFLASQETKRLEMTQRQGGLHGEPESQKHGGPKIRYPQELRDLGPQRHQTISPGGKILPQRSGVPQLETQPERQSPETPPLMWWVLEMGRQGMQHGRLKEEELVPLQETMLRQPDPQDTFPGQQNTSGLKERKDLKTSMMQEKVTGDCKDAHHCDIPPPQEHVGPGSPQPMKAQGMLGSNPESLSCSDTLEGEKIKTGNCPAHETLGHDKTNNLLSPGRLPGKSKSLDFRELRPPKPPELRELESPEAQGRPRDFQAQEDPQRKFRKLQQPKDPQALQAQERSDLEGFQGWGQGGEILPSLHSSLQLKPVELMEPHILPPQELVVLHVQGTLQVDPEALKSQRHIDSKAICPQGHQEAGGSGGEFWAEEKPPERQEGPPKNLQICLAQETTQLHAHLLGNSVPCGVQELSKPCSFQVQEKQNQAPSAPQVAEDQAQKGLETFAPQMNMQMVANPLQDAKHESPVQKELSNQEISQPQEEIEDSDPGDPNFQGDTEAEVLQLQEKKETEDLGPSGGLQMENTPLSFGATDSKHTQDLQADETQPKKPETPETTDHAEPSTWLSPGYSELWEFWRMLGKSKSLDVRELRALQLEALGEEEFSRLQTMSRTKIWQPQRKPENDPGDVHSKFLPIHELILKDHVVLHQPLERGGCEVERPQMTGLESLQAEEQPRSKREIHPSQEVEGAQIFHPQKHGIGEDEEEPLQVPRAVERPPEAAEPQGLMDPKPLTLQENREVESPPLLKGLLRKSKTAGPETLARRDAFHLHDVRRTESHSGWGTPKTRLQGQGSHNIQGPSEEPQETLCDVEGTLETPRPEEVEFHREASTMEIGMAKAEGPLFPVNCGICPEERDAPFTSPERSQALSPYQAPLLGIEPLQELGSPYGELETHRPQEWKDQEAVHPQETQECFESEGQVAVEPQGALDAQAPQHPALQTTESHLLVEQKTPEAPPILQGLEEDEGSCQSPEILNRELGSRGSPKLEMPQISQRQECLPETSPVVPILRVSHPINSQEFRDPAIFCPQESPEIGWESHEDEGKELQADLGRSELQEHFTLAPQRTLQWKSRSLDPQELSRMKDFQGQRGEDDPHAQHGEVRELERETTETKKPLAVTAFSPPSPGRYEEELTWEPAALSVGISRESSSYEPQPERASRLSQQPPEEGMPAEGEGATELSPPESRQNRTWQLPSPRPPRREKAFIWLSRQEQEEALQQLAELRAKGELRHRRDKERQILRFQERLSIAKHRKSEDDLLGSGSAERWTPPTEHQGQDEAGQKTAVKRHLEKVKRERTYVMQSKRERNTLRFKELLDPLVTPGEASPEPGQLGDE